MKRKRKPKGAPKTKAFLAAIAAMPNVTWAARAAGIRRELHYRRLKTDPVYQRLFDEAWRMGCGALEDRAIARSMEGVEEPVFYQGEECGFVTRYYHTEFLLRGAMPDKYRERIDHKVDPGDGMKKFAGTLEELLAVYRQLTQQASG